MQNKFVKYLERGLELQQANDIEGAEKQYLRALKLDKRHPEVLHRLGTVNVQMRRYPEAVKYFERAIAADPNAIHSLHNLAIVYQGLGQDDQAIETHQKVLAIQPGSAETYGHLARLCEERNRVEDAQAYVDEGLKIDGFNAMLNLITVRLDRRAKRYEDGLHRLTQMLEPIDRTGPLRKKFLFEKGRLLDLTGAYPDAFQAFTDANKISAATGMASTAVSAQYTARIDQVRAAFTPEFVAGWQPRTPDYTGENLVFLVGFPRSGTTLLDNILASHPDVETLSELPAVLAMVNTLHALPGGYPACLTEISEKQIAAAQKAYFDVIAAHGIPRDKVIVDKLPLNLIYGGVLSRIFPDAKYILALRHPCDSCLSCLMQDFEPNDAMANFFTMDDTVDLYEKVMNLWLHYRTLVPLPEHRHRYEDVVADFDPTVKSLLDFLGLEWVDTVKQFDKTARDRSHIRTPSYDQVSRPIYTEARYRWTRYEDQLTGAAARLKPFIEEFGYKS